MSQKKDLCRICLAVDVRLHSIADTSLQTVFERVTNTPLHTADSRPVAACYICHAQLKRCLSLMHTSAKAEKMLTGMLQHKPKGSNKLKSLMDHNGNSLCKSLSITPVDCIDTFSFNAPITVKEEYVLDIVKQEIEFEECIGLPQNPNQSSDQYNDKCEVDLKDDDVLRSLQLEQECYSYKVKIEPMGEESSSWQNTALATKSVSISEDQTQAKESDLLVKKQRKHSKGHKRKHNEKHLKKQGEASIKSKKQNLEEYKSSNENPESQKSRHNKYFECNDCQYQFHRKCHLETHIILHKGEKPFQCSYCQKRFNFKHGLERHLKTHTGEKSFECPVCQKMFVEKSVMKIHLRTHTGEQPYECDICEKRFKQRNDLKRHRRTHTGEKPFKCDICQRRFNERSKVARHQKRHYGEKLTKRDLKKLFI